MGDKKQVWWLEKGKQKTFISPSISQVKRVKEAAKGRGAENISKILSTKAPPPITAYVAIKVTKWPVL